MNERMNTVDKVAVFGLDCAEPSLAGGWEREFPTADTWRFDTSRRRDSWRMREGDQALS